WPHGAPTRGAATVSRTGQVEVDYARERRLAHPAERHVVPGEHDAVHLGPEVAAGLVHRALERPHLPRVLTGPEDAADLGLLASEERVHLRLRATVGADLLPLRLDGPAVGFELVLSPWGGSRRAGRGERL